MSEGNPETTVPWFRQRHLAEHWGRVMAAQDGLIVADYRARVVEGIRDLLASETFGPKAVIALLAQIEVERTAESHEFSRRAREARAGRLKANGGCPICADADTPDPDGHREFHDRMTEKAA